MVKSDPNKTTHVALAPVAQTGQSTSGRAATKNEGDDKKEQPLDEGGTPHVNDKKPEPASPVNSDENATSGETAAGEPVSGNIKVLASS